MKKYKLLKDLPWFDAGTICTLEPALGGSSTVFTQKDSEVVMSSVDVERLSKENKFDEWFEEIEDGPWEPKEGEAYYYIDSYGDVYESTWDSDYTGDYDIGNCFRTREDAEKVVEKLKALKRLRDAGLKFDGWLWHTLSSDLEIRGHIGNESKFEFNNDEFRAALDLLFREGD